MDLMSVAQLLGSFGEFVGAIAVVATLGYLTLEVRRSRLAKMVDEGRGLTFTREVSGEFMEVGYMAFEGSEVRLRLECHATTVTAMARANHETVWTTLGKTRLAFQPPRVGLATGAGSPDDPRWARYSGFLVSTLPGVTKPQ